MSTAQTPTAPGSAMGRVVWHPVARRPDWPRGLPYPTHEGRMDLGDISVRVVTMSDGERTIDDDSMDELLGLDR